VTNDPQHLPGADELLRVRFGLMFEVMVYIGCSAEVFHDLLCNEEQPVSGEMRDNILHATELAKTIMAQMVSIAAVERARNSSSDAAAGGGVRDV
jgi:hypothetical protein